MLASCWDLSEQQLNVICRLFELSVIIPQDGNHTGRVRVIFSVIRKVCLIVVIGTIVNGRTIVV